MKTPQLNRRQVLRGIGGFTLALPLLPSLLTPSEAKAQAAAPAKRFIQFCTDHGGVWGSNMFPADPSAQTQEYAGRTIRRGPLSLEVASGRARLSWPQRAHVMTSTPISTRKAAGGASRSHESQRYLMTAPG